MATIVVKKCPECGARFQLDLNEDHAKCSYCGTVARIASKKHPPPPKADKAEPVIYVSPSYRGAWVSSIVVTLIIMGVSMAIAVGRFASSGAGTGPGSGGSAGQSFGEHMQWDGWRHPMLVDLTGDGIMDVVGWVTFQGGNASNSIAAFNAVTGDRLWVTPAIADSSQSSNCRAALYGDKLVVADPAGVVKSFALASGAPGWQTVMGERVDRFCAGPAGQIAAHLKDKRSIGIAAATGQMTILGKVEHDTPCPPLQTDNSKNGPFFMTGGGPWDSAGIVTPRIEGMSVDKVLVNTVNKRTVALGTRNPGTRTPMAALYQMTNQKEKTATAFWMTGVSSQNPLTVEEGAPEWGAISQGRVVVPYELEASGAGFKLSCLDENTGRILWDVPIPRSDTGVIRGFTASQHHVFVSHWTYLDIFQLADGAHTLTIGVW